MPRYNLTHTVGPDGFEFRLVKLRSVFAAGGELTVSAWTDDLHPGLPLLRQMAEAGIGTRSDMAV
jgi:hypothetical protein